MPRPAKRHHFLPQGYLAGFTDTERKDGLLRVLDLRNRTSFRTSPLNIAVEKDFKRIDVNGHPPDAIETALSKIEDEMISAVRRIVQAQEFPTDNDLNLALNLLSLVVAQNPKTRAIMNHRRALQAKQLMDKVTSSRDEWERHIKYARAYGENIGLGADFASARKFVEEERYTIQFSSEGTLRAEFDSQSQLLETLGTRTWSLLLAPTGGPGFICSDFPIGVAMEYGHRGVFTFAGNNTELFFPLSQRVGLIGIRGTSLKPVLSLSPRKVALMNTRVLRQAYKQLYLPADAFTILRDGAVTEIAA